jgi:hypothetical protein
MAVHVAAIVEGHGEQLFETRFDRHFPVARRAEEQLVVHVRDQAKGYR